MNPARAVIVVQARMGSRRLPGKALAPIHGVSLLGHGLTRLAAARIAPLLLATTTLSEDDVLVAEAQRYGVPAFRGSSGDVLGRFVAAADATGAGFLVRATADNPAVDPRSAARLLDFACTARVDHAIEEGLPYGATVEVVAMDALRRAAAEATRPDDREHVTLYIRRLGNNFRRAVLQAPAALHRPDLRFTVDTAADLAYMRAVIGLAERCSPGRRASLAELIVAADRVAGREDAA